MSKYNIMVEDTEKEIYRIFKDLERYGRTTFSYNDSFKQQSIARKIGIKVRPLVEKKMMIPPLSSTNRHRMTGIQLPTNVIVKEKKGRKASFFHFYRYNK